MQVQVWPNKIEYVEHPLPDVPANYEEVVSAIVNAGDGVVFWIRANVAAGVISEIYEWTEDGGFERLEKLPAHEEPLPPGAKRMMWLKHDHDVDHVQLNGEANLFLLHDSYTNAHPVECHFKTSKEKTWIIHSVYVP